MLTDSRKRAFARSIKPKSFRPFLFSNPPSLLKPNSPGLLAANRNLPRPPRDAEEEESKGSAPLAKDDTDDTRLRGLAAVVVVGKEALANVALPTPLVLARPPRAATPPEPREAQVVVVARIVKEENKRC